MSATYRCRKKWRLCCKPLVVVEIPEKLLSANPRIKVISPFAAASINATPVNVLCQQRGSYAVLASQAAYLNTVAGTLTNLETPKKSSNVVEALASIFKTNAIKTPDAKDDATQVVKRCEADLDGSWTAEYYHVPGPAAAAAPLDVILTPLCELTSLFNIAQGIFDFISQYQRLEQINDYLKGHSAEITKAAKNLVTAEQKLVPRVRA
jgi:hypothetical protein